MRSLAVAFLLSASVLPACADIVVVCPPLVRDGLQDFAATYTKTTGKAVSVRADVMGKIMDDIAGGVPAPDVVLLPPNLMNSLASQGGIRPQTRTQVGRVEIALAVRAGAPHPDISTVSKLKAVLHNAQLVVYTQPGPPRNSMEAGIIDGLMHRPEFADTRTKTIADSSGISALANGEGDMAMQVVPAVTAQRGVELVGPLPPELGAHIDTETAVSTRSSNIAEAAEFVRYITRPDAAPEWKKFGLDRQP
ncbi:MAG TPA: substrate-binding domain-containing protein [Rhizomicrobium sp.]|nr:substrate-binding domain-containing protein [Rhizomicrobium sp.]